MSKPQPRTLTPISRNDDWLTREELAELTPEKALHNLREVAGLIADHALATERQRYPTEAVWSAVRKSGLFYFYVPKEHGGLSLETIEPMIDALVIIAGSCASTAWCAAQCLMHQWQISLMGDRFQQEVFGTLPYVTAAGSAFPLGSARRVDGGFRLTGRFRWGSGIMYAQWIFAFALAEETDGRKLPYLMFVPIDDVTVFDTWQVDGMMGTGSHDFELSDVFVPEHRAYDAMLINRGQPDKPNPIQRLPLPVFAPFLSASTILGAARGAVAAYRARLATGGPGGRPVERALDHVCLARADLAVKVADLAIRDAGRQSAAAFAGSVTISEAETMQLRVQPAYAAELAKQALRSISDISGSSAHLLGNALQRAVRDANMLGTHIAMNPSTTNELYGRLMLGLPADAYAGVHGS
jgi:alkylation response protein AidB-like acyl-CoA dehydrogenase